MLICELPTRVAQLKKQLRPSQFSFRPFETSCNNVGNAAFVVLIEVKNFIKSRNQMAEILRLKPHDNLTTRSLMVKVMGIGSMGISARRRHPSYVLCALPAYAEAIGIDRDVGLAIKIFLFTLGADFTLYVGNYDLAGLQL